MYASGYKSLREGLRRGSNRIGITVTLHRGLTCGAASPVICLVVDAGVAAVLPPGGVTGGRGGLDVAQVLRDVNRVHYRSIGYPRPPNFSLTSSV